MSASITLNGVVKDFADRRRSPQHTLVLDGIDLEIPAGQRLTLVGPSGSGKTTLLDLLGGFSRPTAGKVLVADEPVTGPGPERAVVFQQYALFPWRTALENVLFPLEELRVPKRERIERAGRYLELVGLGSAADRFPAQLSGGMQQRVAIARALVTEPQVLLMDEPFGALDAQTRELLQRELLGILQTTGATIVFITHSVDEAVLLGERVIVLSSGPGARVAADLTISLPTGIEHSDFRSNPEFLTNRHRVWAALELASGRRLPTQDREEILR